MEHPVPKQLAGPLGWWYVFGSASLTLFVVQIVTGIGLSLVFVPSADKAYESLLYLNYDHPLGWFLRSLHYYAGTGMVVMVLVHMTQVFLHGAYKYPRELTWVTGACLLLCTLGMFFTGQVLRWDPDAYWGLAVGASMAGRVPLLGPQVVHLVVGRARDRRRRVEPVFRAARLRNSRRASSRCSACIFGWSSSGASAFHRSPGRSSIQKPTTPSTRKCLTTAFRFSAKRC